MIFVPSRVSAMLLPMYLPKAERAAQSLRRQSATPLKSRKAVRLTFTRFMMKNCRLKKKLACIAKNIYGADDVVYTSQAEKDIKEIEMLGADKLPICVAKTQYSLSDNPELLGRPEHFSVTVRNLKLSAGAGFIVALTGNIMTMPGLPKSPAALRIDIDKDGTIAGLF